MIRRTESEWLLISDDTISIERGDAAKAKLSVMGIFFIYARMDTEEEMFGPLPPTEADQES
jgi:hypothetical protein